MSIVIANEEGKRLIAESKTRVRQLEEKFGEAEELADSGHGRRVDGRRG